MLTNVHMTVTRCWNPLHGGSWSRALQRISATRGLLVGGGRRNRTCLKCRNAVEVDEDGRVVAHDRPVSRFPCRASGQLAILVSVEWGPGAVPGLRIVGEGRRRQPDRRKKAEYLQAPEWIPGYKGERLPSVGLPASGWFGVWLPAHTMWEHERKLSGWVGSDRSLRWDGHQGCWTIASSHFPRVSRELLRRYPNVLIGREYNPNERCNSSCQNAKGFLCTCSCRGRYHGGGRWRRGWRILGEFSGRRAGKPWHWMAVTNAK